LQQINTIRMVKFELNTPKGLTDLNKHLEERSYVNGYIPSQADVETFKGIEKAPDATKYVNVSRWWNHIHHFDATVRKTWPGEGAAASAPAAAAKEEKKDDDDVDLFADEEDDAEHQAEIQRRADELEARKKAAGKVREAAKSAVVLDVKPWDDETDLAKMEEGVRAIAMDGLDWKASKLQPIGYGIKKLQISCHVVDDLVSIDDLIEKIQDGLPDLVQSVDVHTFTKL